MNFTFTIVFENIDVLAFTQNATDLLPLIITTLAPLVDIPAGGMTASFLGYLIEGGRRQLDTHRPERKLDSDGVQIFGEVSFIFAVSVNYEDVKRKFFNIY